ncbi:hypothetical protein WR25_25703 isoform B [Diploscapter pachys]|uniref:FHA domain-containing protein n=1 Tax=Diploscapter pachys TaxID=2018661 RepID=A0A2A2LYD3_9BILA|nr:hypothetical protein WR25_25703 isoform B [Diploscapter pachys]
MQFVPLILSLKGAMFTDWGKEEWQEFGKGVLTVLVSFAFFRLMQFVVRWYLFGKCTFRTFSYFGFRNARIARRAGDSRELTVVPPNKKWRISNEVVSLIHSVISGLWAAYALLFFTGLINDMIKYRCSTALTLILMSGGYLLHDLIDLLVNERSARIIELLFHHVIVLTGFATTLLTELYLGVVIFGLLMELNSIFLHSRSLLNLFGYDKKSVAFRMVALFNILTMFAFRLCVSVYLCYWAGTNIWSIKWYHAVLTVLVILSLATTNSVLAYRVMAADGLLGEKRARKSPAQTVSTTVDPDADGGENGGISTDEVDEEDSEPDDHLHEVAVQTPRLRLNSELEMSSRAESSRRERSRSPDRDRQREKRRRRDSDASDDDKRRRDNDRGHRRRDDRSPKRRSSDRSPPRRRPEREEARDHGRVKREPESPSERRIKKEPESPERRRGEREKNDAGNHYGLEKRAKREKQEEQKWGRPEMWEAPKEDENPIVKEKVNMETSGTLAEDTNMYKGVLIKYNEPPEAKKPKLRWRLYPFKGDEALPVLYIHRQSAYLIGRDRKIADLPIDHPSCSKQHAVLQYRSMPFVKSDGTKARRILPYIIDLGSANGTFLNGERIEAKRSGDNFFENKTSIKFPILK